jgi:hypothetical protein
MNMKCILLRGQVLIGVKNTLVGVKKIFYRGVKFDWWSEILYVGGLKYFSGGQILKGVNIFIGRE